MPQQKESQLIKTITPSSCPHCSELIFITHFTMQPTISEILTRRDIDQAKEKVREQISKISFKDAKEKISFENWIDQDDTLFSLDDADTIIQDIIKAQKI